MSDGYLTCSVCNTGSYKESAGNLACTLCPSGKVMQTYITGSQKSSECTPCDVRSYMFSQAGNTCVPCNPGSYSSAVGASTCTLCESGKVSSVFGASQCSSCPVGKVTMGPGQLNCVDPGVGTCSPGQYSITGTPPCESCIAGRYSSIAAATSCNNCPPGSVATGSGQVICLPCSSTQYAVMGHYCVSCPAGQQPSKDQTGCINCLPGHFSQNSSYLATGYLTCTGCPTGTYSSLSGSMDCIPCPRDYISNTIGSSQCTPCQSGYHQPLSSQSYCVAIDAISGVLSNQGTPLYIIALLSILMGAFGLFVSFGKQAAIKIIYVPPTLKTILDFFIFAGSVGSEMVLASGLVGSIDARLNAFGIILIISRTCLGSFPAFFILVSIVRSNQSTYKSKLHAMKLYEDSMVYGLVIALSILDCKLLTHLPWLQNGFVEASKGYPTLMLLRLCLVFSVIQLLPTFAVQIGTLVIHGYSTSGSGTLLAVLILNVGFSAFKFIISLLDIFLKYNALSDEAALTTRQESVNVVSIYNSNATATLNEIFSNHLDNTNSAMTSIRNSHYDRKSLKIMPTMSSNNQDSTNAKEEEEEANNSHKVSKQQGLNTDMSSSDYVSSNDEEEGTIELSTISSNNYKGKT